LQSEWSD